MREEKSCISSARFEIDVKLSFKYKELAVHPRNPSRTRITKKFFFFFFAKNIFRSTSNCFCLSCSNNEGNDVNFPSKNRCHLVTRLNRITAYRRGEYLIEEMYSLRTKLKYENKTKSSPRYFSSFRRTF